MFYVALTRAQIKLFITYAQFLNDGRAMEPSRFIAEILDIHDIPPQKEIVNAEAMSEFQTLQFQELAAPEIGKMEKEFIERIFLALLITNTFFQQVKMHYLTPKVHLNTMILCVAPYLFQWAALP